VSPVTEADTTSHGCGLALSRSRLEAGERGPAISLAAGRASEVDAGAGEGSFEVSPASAGGSASTSALDSSAARVAGLMPALDAYLTRVWREGRDADGLFTAGGIGSYDGSPAIDAGGLAQLFALRAWPRHRREEAS